MGTGIRAVNLREEFLSMTSNLNCSLGAYMLCQKVRVIQDLWVGKECAQEVNFLAQFIPSIRLQARP